MKKPRQPDFIGIGAARSGTTWLANALLRSPDVWLPKRKELHYFTRSPDYPSTAFLNGDSFFERAFAHKGHSRRFRHELLKAIGGSVRDASFERLKWELRYFCEREHNNRYENLFADRPEACVGEITPAYALLSDADTKALCERLPDTRFIYIVRNPVDRAWSTISYHEVRQRNKGLDNLSDDELLERLDVEGISARSSYCDTIERWRHYAGEDRFMLAFYDQIRREPEQLMQSLATFLELPPIEGATELSTRVVNKSSQRPMPDSIRRRLSERFRDEVARLAKLAGGDSESWLQQIDACIAEASAA